jgi:hypothetical protein
MQRRHDVLLVNNCPGLTRLDELELGLDLEGVDLPLSRRCLSRDKPNLRKKRITNMRPF